MNDAIKYYGEPYEEWTKDKSSVVMKKTFPFVVNEGEAGRLHGAPSGSKIYWFKQYHPEDPKFLYCIVVYLVDKDGNILKLQEFRCRERPSYLR